MFACMTLYIANNSSVCEMYTNNFTEESELCSKTLGMYLQSYCYFLRVSYTCTCSVMAVYQLRSCIVIGITYTSSCARFVTCARSSLRFNYFVLWSSASLAPTQHIYKLVSEHYPDCNGNSSAHVQGRRQLNLLLSGLCNTTPTMLYT